VNWTNYATAAAESGTGTATFNTGGFARGTRYFKVTAVGSGGESAASNVVQFTV
jgi:Tfp pilus assembly protein PilX